MWLDLVACQAGLLEPCIVSFEKMMWHSSESLPSERWEAREASRAEDGEINHAGAGDE